MDLANEGLLFPKHIRERKPVKGLKAKIRLKAKTKLKAHYEPIPKNIKEAVLEQKGRLCLMGLCEVCGGLSMATELHHFPHRSKAGQNIPEHLWPINRECHSYLHDHPGEERMIFHEIEKAGYKVIWKAKTKGIEAA